MVSKNLPAYLLLSVVLLFTCLLLLYPQFGLIDDHQLATSLRTEGSPRYFINSSVDNGHFEPLDSQEYTALSVFLPFTARMCYAFNALQLVVLAVVSVSFLKNYVPQKWSCIAVMLMLLSPGFVSAWFRLNVGDRGALFWMVVSLHSSELFAKSGNWLYLLSTTVSANFAIYYKEPVFAAVATYSSLQLLAALCRWNWSRKDWSYAAMLSSSIAFLVLYYILIMRHQTGNYADQRRFISTLDNQIYCLRWYSLEGYPAFFFLLIPDAILALQKTIRFRFGDLSASDTLSVSACAYIFLILALNMPVTAYYLLPAYAFALAPIALRLSSTKWADIHLKIWLLGFAIICIVCAMPTTWIRILLNSYLVSAIVALTLIAIIIFFRDWYAKSLRQLAAAMTVVCVAGNQVPNSVNAMAQSKYGPWQFQEFLSALHDTVQRRAKKPVNIFLLDTPRGNSCESYTSIGEYLRGTFKVSTDFNLYSEIPAESKFIPDASSDYEVFKDSLPHNIHSGDLLIGMNSSPDQLSHFLSFGALIYSSRPRHFGNVPSLNSIIQDIKNKLKKDYAGTEKVDYLIIIAK